MKNFKLKQLFNAQSIGKGFFVLGLLLYSFSSIAQNTLFLSALGGEGDEEMECILETGDNGLLIAGYTDSYSAGEDGDALIIKTDKNGVVSWAKTFGGTEDDMATDAKETPDGGYIIAGWTQSFGAASYDFWVFKIDVNGNMQWEYRYGGNGAEQAWSVDIDGTGYMVAGGTDSFGAGLTDIWVLKLDINGGIVWQKTYGSGGDDAPPGMYEEYVARGLADKNGRYVISGVSDSLGHGGDDIWVARLNSGDGSIIWQYAYGDTDDESTWSFAEAANGGYFLSGNITFLPSYEADLWALHIDTTGNILWQKAFGVTGVWDEALYAAGTSDGGLLLGAYIEQTDSDWIAALLKINNDGSLPWYNKYDIAHLDWTNAVQPLNDNTIALTGVTTNTDTWNEDMLLARTDSNGVIGTCGYVSSFTPNITSTTTSAQAINVSVANTVVVPQSTSSSVTTVQVTENTLCNEPLTVGEIHADESDVLIYPNPSSHKSITIDVVNGRNKSYRLMVYNSTGKFIMIQTTFKNSITFNTGNFESGLYFYQIQGTVDKKVIKRGKFIIQ